VAPSSATRNILIAKYGYDPDATAVIPNCLSRSEVEEAGLGAETLGEFHTQKVIFAGRLQWQKGFDTFLSIVNQLSRVRPGTNFCVFGRGERIFEEKLRYPLYSISRHTINYDYNTASSYIDSNMVNDKSGIISLIPVDIEKNGAEGHYHAKRFIRSLQERDDIVREIVKRGFTIENHNFSDERAGIPNYSFLLTVKGDCAGFHRHYFVGVTNQEILNRCSTSSDKQVVYQGFKPWEQRHRVFEGASLCIVPSRFEPFGLVILEAMAHGVPVIYPKQAGVSEFVKTGVQVDFSDMEQVLFTASTLLDDIQYWEETVHAQLEEIRGYYDRPYSAELQNLLSSVSDLSR
jgi:glycosyltransferase involved in cell wall biosynthesis